MIAFLEILVLLAAAEFVSRRMRPSIGKDFRLRSAAALALTAAAAAALAASFWAEVRLAGAFIAAQPAPAPWFAHLPYKWVLRENTAPGTVIYLICVVQSVLLGILLFAVPAAPRRACAAAGGAAFASLAFIALSARFTNPDVLAYIGYAKLGLAHAYAPPAVAFTGSFHAINDHWGTPMIASDYGPFFVAAQQLLVGWVPSLEAGVLLERCINLVLLAGLAALLLRCAGRATAMVCLVNPMLFFYDVIGAHNDLYGIVLLVAAYALVRERPWLALLAILAAASVKVVFAPLAFAVYARSEMPLVRRVVFAAAGLAGGVVLSLAVGGHAWVASIEYTTREQLAHVPFSSFVIQRVVAVAALAALAAALVARRTFGAAAWWCCALAPRLYPWYLTWSIPYALAAGSTAVVLVLLPPLALEFDPLYVVGGHAFALSVLAALVAGTVLFFTLSRVRARRAGSATVGGRA